MNSKRFWSWVIGLVITGSILFVVFKYFSPLSWPWGTIMISLPLWLIALFVFLGYGATRFLAKGFQTTLKRNAERVGTTFQDVGGLEDAKETLKPVVDWLKNPQGKSLGAELVRGVLLTGPSGSGKTLLAHAIAGEAGVPCFAYSGAEFIELFVGVGALRIRNLFSEARKQTVKTNRPCIVFIDQIDLIGGERSAFPMYRGGDAEMQQALGQLLQELDNLAENGLVYVLAATSRPRVLDPALLTPGRLNLPVPLRLPDTGSRRKILDIHLRGKLTHFDLDLDTWEIDDIAANTEGWSGAELAQMVSQATKLARERSEGGTQGQPPASQGKVVVRLGDFEDVKGQMLPQPKRKQPDDIVEHLDTSVIGQKLAKKRLAVAVSNHYLRVSAARQFTAFSGNLSNGQFAASPSTVKKSNVLLIGPTGSGKTLLIETIADYLDVPYVIFNSTVLTETGMAGASVEQILYKLLVAADLNLRKAEYGIICIDEFDKLAFHRGESARHAGAGVQQELLKIIEGTVVDVPKSGGERHGDNPDYYQFNTRNILFVCLGAFIGVEAVIEHRLNGAVGTIEQSRRELLKRAQPEDVITYGFIPELVGRFPVITFTEQLTVQELTAVLRHPHTGLEHEYKKLLDLQGWQEPHFTDEALECVAVEASRRGVGARALRGIMEEVLLEKMYKRPKKYEAGEGDQASGNDENTPTSNCTLTIDKSWVEGVFNADPSILNDPGNQTAEKLVQKLDEQFVGQAQAKQTLAILSLQHYRRQLDASRSKLAETEAQKPVDASDAQPPARKTAQAAILLVDPYMGRRLHLVQALAHIWQVPWVSVHADKLERSLNESGGQGAAWLFEPVSQLLHKTDYDLHKAQQGIVFINNFDTTSSKVTMHSAYSVLAEQLPGVIQGERVPLQLASGRNIEFKTDGLFFILGGDFRFRHERAKSFIADPAFLDKYQPGALLSNLKEEFRLPEQLLQHLFLVSLDLSLTEKDLKCIITQEDERLQGKYADLLTHSDLQIHRSPAEYDQLVKQVRESYWNISDIRENLESWLLEQLHQMVEPSPKPRRRTHASQR
ncbi:MAG: AAA family ATPase [Ktedonobacteraceae bacterium]